MNPLTCLAFLACRCDSKGANTHASPVLPWKCSGPLVTPQPHQGLPSAAKGPRTPPVVPIHSSQQLVMNISLHFSSRRTSRCVLHAFSQGSPLGPVLQAPTVAHCSLAHPAWISFASHLIFRWFLLGSPPR